MARLSVFFALLVSLGSSFASVATAHGQVVRASSDARARAAHAVARPLRQIIHLHAFAAGDLTLALFIDRYDGPLEDAEQCDDRGGMDIPPACETYQRVPPAEVPEALGIVAIDAAGTSRVVALTRTPRRDAPLGYDWWLADLDGDSSDELWVDVTTGSPHAVDTELWIVGAREGRAVLRLREPRGVWVVERGHFEPPVSRTLVSVEASGPTRVTLSWERRAPIHCHTVDDSGYPECDALLQEASVDVMIDADGRYDLADDEDPFEGIALPPTRDQR